MAAPQTCKPSAGFHKDNWQVVEDKSVVKRGTGMAIRGRSNPLLRPSRLSASSQSGSRKAESTITPPSSSPTKLKPKLRTPIVQSMPPAAPEETITVKPVMNSPPKGPKNPTYCETCFTQGRGYWTNHIAANCRGGGSGYWSQFSRPNLKRPSSSGSSSEEPPNKKSDVKSKKERSDGKPQDFVHREGSDTSATTPHVQKASELAEKKPSECKPSEEVQKSTAPVAIMVPSSNPPGRHIRRSSLSLSKAVMDFMASAHQNKAPATQVLDPRIAAKSLPSPASPTSSIKSTSEPPCVLPLPIGWLSLTEDPKPRPKQAAPASELHLRPSAPTLCSAELVALRLTLIEEMSARFIHYRGHRTAISIAREVLEEKEAEMIPGEHDMMAVFNRVRVARAIVQWFESMTFNPFC